jgi:kinesin family protein 2/24
MITVHECKFKVDGITKYVDNSEFVFDNSFSHLESNDELYKASIEPILDLVFNQGIVTVFAYGQTGSGKTYTM